MEDLLQTAIFAERTGDWLLHLHTLLKMHPFYAAAGHNHYTKGVHLYPQSMQHLQETNSNVYEKFLAGYHVVQRTDRHWAGLSTDLVIEQSLMRSIKSEGALTRGRGISESQRAL